MTLKDVLIKMARLTKKVDKISCCINTNAASGTFVSLDGKTVTVVKGLITSIV